MTACYVLTLDEVDASSLALVGGKGANLGELFRAGFPVPAAYCVTTDAYSAHVDGNRLGPAVAEALGGVDYDDAASIADRAGCIRDAILAAPVPDGVEAAIREAHRRLEDATGSGSRVSVRSSATAEDLPGTSFAGQHDTYLNVTGSDQMVDAVRRCWASLWTDRAIAYRHRQGFSHGDVRLAVVVQQMFPAEVSGVLFTANPVTSDPGQFLIDMSWGLGEAIVSGQVDPDEVVVDRRTLRVVERRIGNKLVMTSPAGSGTVPVADHLRRAPTLTDAEIKELCELGRRIEDHYGVPQDVEWGRADGRFAVLQAREITGADLDFGEGLELWKTPVARADMYHPRWVWSRAYSDEVQTGPSTPLFYTQLQHAMSNLKAAALRYTGVPRFLGYDEAHFADFPYFRWYGARAYYNLAFEEERIRRWLPPFARDEAALWPFPVADRERIRNLPFNWPRFLWTLAKLEMTNRRISLLGTTRVMYEGVEGWAASEEAVWREIDLETASIDEILAARRRSIHVSGFGENVVLPFSIYLFVLPAALRALCRRWLDDPDGRTADALLAGLQTKTGEENLAVWRLSRLVAASPGLRRTVEETDDDLLLDALGGTDEGRRLLAALDDFVAAYGHRGGAERDPFHKRWRHDPALVFHSIRPMLALGEDESPEVRERWLRERMQTTRSDCVARLRRMRFGRPRAWLFTRLVDLTQDYAYYRDFERFHNDRTMSRPRDMFLAIARKLIARGLLSEEEDIFFLGKEEVRAVDRGELDARQVELRVRARRRVYEKYSHREPPKYLRGWEAFDDNSPEDAEGALRGVGASSGIATGRARVCRELRDISRVEKGDILVTVATDPGWTTVFSIVSGVVVETGGVVAHAVMISREYGLPCVAHVARACDLIPDGATVTVDGTTGRVVVHDAEASPPASS